MCTSTAATEGRRRSYCRLDQGGSENTVNIHFEPYSEITPCYANRFLIQGDPAAPDLFNACLDVPAKLFLEWCLERDYGIKLNEHCWISFILLADSFWIFATSPSMLQAMTQRWTTLLQQHGWSTPVEELTWWVHDWC